MERKKKEMKHISRTGTILFNGTLTLTIKGRRYKVRTEYHGLDLQKASQNHELVVLIRQHLPYNELDTGYLVRTKAMDKEHTFGLKARKSDRTWSVYDYTDVVAWGYADGGLNSRHFNSCRMRPEDYPEYTSEVYGCDKDLVEEAVNTQPGLTCKFRNAGDTIDAQVIWPAGDIETLKKMPEGADAASRAFMALNEEHPEFVEAHFFTEPTPWLVDDEEDECEA